MYSRFAVFYAPRSGAFSDAADAWLGRNCVTGFSVAQPALKNTSDLLFDLTTKPRKYGFHGTLRAPFRPGPGQDEASISSAVCELAKRLAPAKCDGLSVGNPYGFGVALIPLGDQSEIIELAKNIVEETDCLRAQLTEEEILQREQSENLNEQQRIYLHRWGYPTVMDELSFQLTLSNRVTPQQQLVLEAAIAEHFEGLLPSPFLIEDLCLFGEDAKSGMLILLKRYPLSG